MVCPWHRLPREAMVAPSLEAFKARLNGACSNLVSGGVPAHGRVVEKKFLSGPNPNPPTIV